jgi:MtN3 and saliva related transmembrane protein
MSLLSILALTFGTISGIANLPQWVKIFKRKSAGDISIITYSFLFIGAVVWIFYGFEINDFPIIITNILGGLNIGMVVVGWFLYGKKVIGEKGKK